MARHFLEMSITKVHCKLAKLETIMLAYFSFPENLSVCSRWGSIVSGIPDHVLGGGRSSFSPFMEELDAQAVTSSQWLPFLIHTLVPEHPPSCLTQFGMERPTRFRFSLQENQDIGVKVPTLR